MRRFAIRCRLSFFLVAALIGYLNAGTLIGSLLWTGVIFCSILFHECGHASCARLFGKIPQIELMPFGGVTLYEGAGLSSWKQFLIILAGPLFGVFLFFASGYFLTFPNLASGLTGAGLKIAFHINFFWTALNLLPILPLDGGQLVRILLESWFGIKGVKISLWISLSLAFLTALFFLLYGQFLAGGLFFFLGFQSFLTLRALQGLNPIDQEEELKALWLRAEELLTKGDRIGAIPLLEDLVAKTQKGLLYQTAVCHLALLYEEEGEMEKSYALLLPLARSLPPEGQILLHRLAFSKGDYPQVIALSLPCFQHQASSDIALRNAYAHGSLGEAKACIGWLQAARDLGLASLKNLLEDPHLDKVRTSPEFLAWTQENSTKR